MGVGPFCPILTQMVNSYFHISKPVLFAMGRVGCLISQSDSLKEYVVERQPFVDLFILVLKYFLALFPLQKVLFRKGFAVFLK